MNPNNRMLEILSEMLIRQEESLHTTREMKDGIFALNTRMDRLTDRVDKLTDRVEHLTDRVDHLTGRVDRLNEEQALTNLSISELRHSVMTMANKYEIVLDHEKRIDRLEQKVFH